MKNINEDLIKRSLLYMNYDSKKTLSENVDRVILNEATTGKEYILKMRYNNRMSMALSTLKVPKGLPITKRGNVIEIGKPNTEHFYGYNCDTKNFGYMGSLTGSQGAAYEEDYFGKILDYYYCSGNPEEVDAAERHWDYKFGMGKSRWADLWLTLGKNGYDFKLLDRDKKPTNDLAKAEQLWWKNFIINKNLSKYVFISFGKPTIVSANLQRKYAGESDLTKVILKMSKGYEGSDVMTLKQFLDTDWKAVPKKEEEKVIDYTQEKKKASGGGTGGGTGGGSKPKNECKGTYSMGCITPEVGEAQQCLKDDGLYPYRVDNKFGSKTRDAVKAKIGKTYFTDADLQTICKTKKGGGGDDEYDFDKDMGGGSGQQEKEDTTWTGDVY